MRRAASRIASSRRRRSASAVARSAALGSSPFGGLGQQQARFQIGEPGRHHEVVGGELEAQLARLLDEDEVLLGQRQDRDAVEVDLLPPRKLEQEVERALEAVDVDMQGRLAGRALGKLQILEG